MTLTGDDRNVVEHLQGFFSPGDIAELLAEADSATTDNLHGLSERELTLLDQGAMPSAVRLKTIWFRPWRRDREKMLATVGPYTWIAFPVQVRRMTPRSELVPWHQDSGYQKALGARAHNRVMTCFTPLDADPFARSTIEFGDEQSQYISHQRQGNFDAVLTKHDFRRCYYYRLEQGDSLFFGDYAPHRSFIPNGALPARTTVEYRLVRPQDAIEGKDYFDIESQRFVCLDAESNLNEDA